MQWRRNPRVTVSLPSTGCSPWLLRSVESALAQTHLDLRVVLIGDGGEFGSGSLSAIHDPRLVRFDLPPGFDEYFAHEVVLRATPDPFLAVQSAWAWSEPHRLAWLLAGILTDDSEGAISSVWNHAQPDPPASLLQTCEDWSRPLGNQFEFRGGMWGVFSVDLLRGIGGLCSGLPRGCAPASGGLLLNLLRLGAEISCHAEPLYHRLIRSDAAPVSEEDRRHLRMLYSRSFIAGQFLKSAGCSSHRLRTEIRTIRLSFADSAVETEIARHSARLADLLSNHHPTLPAPSAPNPHRPPADLIRAAEPHSSLDSSGILRHCLQFRTLRRHVASIASEETIVPCPDDFPDDGVSVLLPDPRRVDEAELELERLASLGLLVSGRQLIEEARRYETTPDPPGICSLGIVTRNRPEVLRRAIDSFARNARDFDRSPEFLIVDTSDNAETAGLTTSAHGCQVRYAGCEEIRRYAAHLSARSGLSSSTVDFALLGSPGCTHTTGASRNALLLDTIGTLCLQIDDDTECLLSRPPETLPGLSFTSELDPTHFWFFPDASSATDGFAPETRDVGRLHEGLLGRPLSSVFEESSVDLTRLGPGLDSLLTSGQGRVAVTTCGIRGDSGMGTSAYLFMEPSSLARLIRSEEHYLAAVGSRQVLRSVHRTTLAPRGIFQSYHLGLDNRELLPPFLPVQRGSDAIFCLLLHRCFPSACVGFLPWTILHTPAPARVQKIGETLRKLTRTEFSQIVIQLLQSSPDVFAGASPSDRLLWMGRYLADLSALSPFDFRDLLDGLVRSSAEAEIPAMERAVDRYYVLEPYRRAYLDELKAALRDPAFIVPRDLGSLDLAQRLIARFGELLQIWPSLVAAARQLRAEGIRLTHPLHT